jgi:phosphoribosylaminoimidazole-succinocarboxamide synthase
MTREDAIERIGKNAWEEIGEACLRLYKRACSRAEKNGIIIADTKMEFGFRNGDLLLIDELLTSDSSRFWSSDKYEVGKSQNSFDKQDVRDYLESTGWNRQPPAPSLPEYIITETSRKYIEAYERLTGRKF